MTYEEELTIMEKRLQLKDLYIGSIDAKHELISNSEDERFRFFDSFLIPENIVVDEYITGKKYYVTGLKGTGKTALLRYLAIKVEKELKVKTFFILFKSDFSEQDRRDFARVASTVIVNQNQNHQPTDIDYEDIWRWFLYRHIVKRIKSDGLKIFEKNKVYKQFEACVSAGSLDEESSNFISLFPKMKRGNIEINAGLEGLNGTLGLEFTWDENSKTQIKFSSLVKQADILFSRLTPNKDRLFIFIDELEIAIGKSKANERDIRLIRDLISASHKFNSLCRQKKFDITIITAVRTEVLNSIKSSGKEINKVIADFSTPIIWHQSGDDIARHPLLRIITNKISVSEKYHELEEGTSASEIWERYFPKQIQGNTTPQYILHQTWYRPRDLIRLLVLVKNQYPNSFNFSHKAFDDARKQYSNDSWIEIVEELRTSYSENDIDGIKRLFYGITSPFTYDDIVGRSNMLRTRYDEINQLLDKHKVGKILSDCYRVGILGNMGKKVRWVFRGDDDIILEEQMTIHQALWPFLSVQKIRPYSGPYKY